MGSSGASVGTAMLLKIKSFQTSMRRGFARIEKEVSAWLEEQPSIVVQKTDLQTVGDNILYVLLYSEEQEEAVEAHEPSSFAGSAHYEAAVRGVHEPKIEDGPAERFDAIPREPAVEKPVRTLQQKGLSINHLFRDK